MTPDTSSQSTEKQPADQPQTVLSPNEVLAARTKEGLMKIEAGPYPMRIFSLEGARQGGITTTDANLQYDKASKTLTFDGKPDVWMADHRISRLHYTEGQKTFASTAKALAWLQQQPMDYVYNDNGLALGWHTGDHQLRVAVWQLLIQGKHATLPDAQNDKIAIKSVAELQGRTQKSWFERHIVDPITHLFQ